MVSPHLCVAIVEELSVIEHFHTAHVHLAEDGNFGADKLAVTILTFNDIPSAFNFIEDVFTVVGVELPCLMRFVAGVEAALAEFNLTIVIVGLADLVGEVKAAQRAVLIPVKSFVCFHSSVV
ncbi:MAG: hypothetical protein IIZ94_07295 [Prevotella sp.]|nr:hypothetical protein [Prevotella sp.]